VREVGAGRDGCYVNGDVVADVEKADGVVIVQGVANEYRPRAVGAVVATAHGSGRLGASQQETQDDVAVWRTQLVDGADDIAGYATRRVVGRAHVRTFLVEIFGVMPGTAPKNIGGR
jgi:hypothetical protein